ncbi:MAG: hypothetical protein NHB14_02870 [Desulfosporosinus sp.]|nr:hypothetical protein [Desulfosporosinus sp.]
MNKKYGMSKFFTNEVIHALIDYPWPGNVRELFNLVENLMISAIGDYIELSALPASIRGELNYHSDYERMSLKDATAQFEKVFIRKAIQTAGSVRKAADSLGIDPSTITRKLQK